MNTVASYRNKAQGNGTIYGGVLPHTRAIACRSRSPAADVHSRMTAAPVRRKVSYTKKHR